MLRGWFASKLGSIMGGPDGGPAGRENRGAPRFSARNPHAYVGWQVGQASAFAPMKMVNISRSGLLFAASTAPPDGQPVRIRFADRKATCLEAKVVGIGRAARGPHWIRVTFLEPCPDAVIESVIGEARTGSGATPLGLEAALTLLGLDWPCKGSDVKAAFRLRSKELHPDRGGTVEGFVALREAFESLLMACQPGGDDAADGRKPAPGDARSMGLR